jgi:uncharacterized membrane protein
MFLFLAGCSFTLATMRSGDAGFGSLGLGFRRTKRFVGLIVIGYLMHMPVRWFSDLRYADATAIQGWLQVDVLQCIGLTLLGLQVLALFARTPRRFAAAAFGVGALIVIASPLVWKSEPARFLPAAIAAYLNGNTGSLFPLFPWSGYVCVGAAIGFLCARRPRHLIAMLAAGGVVVAVAGIVLQKMPVTLYGPMEFWKTSPNLALVRLGGVCVLVASIGVASRWLPALALMAKTLGRESLIAYVAHVFILYGSSWNLGLRQAVGASLSPAYTLMSIVALVLASGAIAFGWHSFKQVLSKQKDNSRAPQPRLSKASSPSTSLLSGAQQIIESLRS